MFFLNIKQSNYKQKEEEIIRNENKPLQNQWNLLK